MANAKILFVGDVHIKHNNVEEIGVLMKAMDFVTEPLNFVVVAGDVLDAHEKIDSQLMNRAYDLIDRLRQLAPVYVLVGNHDYINNQQFLTTNHWMNGMKEWRNVVVVDVPMRVDDFVFVPYVYPGRFVEALDRLLDWKTAACVFAHQEIRGCKMGALTSSEGDEWKDDWPCVISGHIHERQTPQPNVLYPGSVLNHAFGYDSQGLSVFTFSNGAFTETRVELDIRKKRIVYTNARTAIPETDLIPSNKFSIAGSAADIAAFKTSSVYRTMQKNGVKTVFRLVDDVDSAAPKYLKRKKPKLFFDIVSKLVEKENDVELEKDYKSIFKI